jgi:hypothetical protein
LKDQNVSGKNSFDLEKKLTKIHVRIGFQECRMKLAFYFQFFCTRLCLHVFGGKIFEGNHFEFFAENIARGNAVQMFSNFPAKSLSIYREDFFFKPFLLTN